MLISNSGNSLNFMILVFFRSFIQNVMYFLMPIAVVSAVVLSNKDLFFVLKRKKWSLKIVVDGTCIHYKCG